MDRREFMKLSSFAAGAALTGCATGRRAAFVPDEKAFVRGALIHLGSNMWTDVYTNPKPRKAGWDDKVAADYVRAHDDVWHAPLEGRICLVMGSEGSGVSALVRKKCDFECKLPQRGRVESLNVAQACTALCYEWLRRAMREDGDK